MFGRRNGCRSITGRGSGQQCAVTLVEILVVMAVLLLLMAVLLPSMRKTREQARRMICAGNLRQWGTALQAYRLEFRDHIPLEGSYLNDGTKRPGTWYNELPPYIGAPRYRDLEGVNVAIKELPNIDVWVCPSKNRTDHFQSEKGKNQFHYGMNEVLDGMGTKENPSPDTPDFPDHQPPDIDGKKQKKIQMRATRFGKHPNTVFMFDIAKNDMCGSPRDVATTYQPPTENRGHAEFHGDYANILYLDGSVTNCVTDDLVTNRNFKRGEGEIKWHHPRFYWGYLPPKQGRTGQ